MNYFKNLWSGKKPPSAQGGKEESSTQTVERKDQSSSAKEQDNSNQNNGKQSDARPPPPSSTTPDSESAATRESGGVKRTLKASTDTLINSARNLWSGLSGNEQKSVVLRPKDVGLITVTNRVFLAPFPSKRSEKLLAAYLKTNYAGRFMIFNLSEKTYDYRKFDNQVVDVRNPGAPMPPIPQLCQLLLHIHAWLCADKRHVCVLHCSRTGVAPSSSVVRDRRAKVRVRRARGRGQGRQHMKIRVASHHVTHSIGGMSLGVLACLLFWQGMVKTPFHVVRAVYRATIGKQDPRLPDDAKQSKAGSSTGAGKSDKGSDNGSTPLSLQKQWLSVVEAQSATDECTAFLSPSQIRYLAFFQVLMTRYSRLFGGRKGEQQTGMDSPSVLASDGGAGCSGLPSLRPGLRVRRVIFHRIPNIEPDVRPHQVPARSPPTSSNSPGDDAQSGGVFAKMKKGLSVVGRELSPLVHRVAKGAGDLTQRAKKAVWTDKGKEQDAVSDEKKNGNSDKGDDGEKGSADSEGGGNEVTKNESSNPAESKSEVGTESPVSEVVNTSEKPSTPSDSPAKNATGPPVVAGSFDYRSQRRPVGACLRPYLQVFREGKLVCTSTGRGGEKEAADWVHADDGSLVFPLDLVLTGDFMLRVRHLQSNLRPVSVLRCSLSTAMMVDSLPLQGQGGSPSSDSSDTYDGGGYLRLPVTALDCASGDLRFPHDFHLDLIYQAASSAKASSDDTTSEAGGSPTDRKQQMALSRSDVQKTPRSTSDGVAGNDVVTPNTVNRMHGHANFRDGMSALLQEPQEVDRLWVRALEVFQEGRRRRKAVKAQRKLKQQQANSQREQSAPVTAMDRALDSVNGGDGRFSLFGGGDAEEDDDWVFAKAPSSDGPDVSATTPTSGKTPSATAGGDDSPSQPQEAIPSGQDPYAGEDAEPMNPPTSESESVPKTSSDPQKDTSDGDSGGGGKVSSATSGAQETLDDLQAFIDSIEEKDGLTGGSPGLVSPGGGSADLSLEKELNFMSGLGEGDVGDSGLLSEEAEKALLAELEDI